MVNNLRSLNLNGAWFNAKYRDYITIQTPSQAHFIDAIHFVANDRVMISGL